MLNKHLPGEQENPLGLENVVIKYTMALNGVFVVDSSCKFCCIAVSKASGIIPSLSLGTTKHIYVLHFIIIYSFIGGGNRNTRRKPATSRKSLTNFIT
jgi:hypothetical protein